MKTAAIFGDHMVLQQGIPFPIWGWAESGEIITATIDGRSATAIAGKDGRWTAHLPAMKAGGPFALTIAGSREISFRDVMVGEVWICSGQSNMQWSVRDSADSEREIREANHPGIRLFTVPNMAQVKPASDIRGEWAACRPDTIAGFSAVAYYFGRELHQKLGVPIGLVNTSWGGTRIEAWMSRGALADDEEGRAEVLKYEKSLGDSHGPQSDYKRQLAEYQRWEKENLPKDAGNSGYKNGWANPSADVSDWKEMTLPRYWQSAGHQMSGVFWFRREVDIPATHAGSDLVLRLGAVDKCDITYFNNVEVGRVDRDTPNCWAVAREYTIPRRLVKPGRNTIAVRVLSDCFAGGFAGNPPEMHLAMAGENGTVMRLDGPWKYRIEQDFGQVVIPPPPSPPHGEGNPNSPHILYDNMIAPLVPFGMRGAIWYQGESNASAVARYRFLLPALIRDWRAAWKQGKFPFLFVQLCNYNAEDNTPGDIKWAKLREAQLKTLSEPNTGMAITIDIGEATDVHPKNKQDVGRRLALSALHVAYGHKDGVHSGPIFRSFQVEGNKVRIQFDHVGGGLIARGGKLIGFEIAGDDSKFVGADAVVEGDTVIVSSVKVSMPKSVRYAWANNPECNLYNRECLPASPFRTGA